MQKHKVIFIAVVSVLVGFFTAKLLISRTQSVGVKPVHRTASVSGKTNQAIGRGPVHDLKAHGPRPVATTATAKMAIVLDDWGNDHYLLNELLEIARPITVAILPHQKYSSRIATEACANGLDVILHMPMQPKNQKVGLEPHHLTVETTDANIVRYTDEALASVGACTEGVNNHMGSAATSDKRVMTKLLTHLKSKGLYFFDSYVIATSKGPEVAKETGIAFVKRDVFIDNVVEIEAIKEKLREAKKIALTRGEVVVIGHDKAPTVETIRQMVPELEKEGVRLVRLKTLVRK